MDKLNILIIGLGEVGKAHYLILSNVYNVWGKDVGDKIETNTENKPIENIDLMLVCIRHNDEFKKVVDGYLETYKPKMLNICTTVPVGTTEAFGPMATHGTTRGLHPDLVSGLIRIKKHIGGGAAPDIKSIYEAAGISCEIHRRARATELLHILNNVHYGVNLIFADEAYQLCRFYGVDYYDWMKYGESNNDGYTSLGHKTKVRPILTPPGGRIGGHCVNMSAGLIPEVVRPSLVKMVSEYGK